MQEGKLGDKKMYSKDELKEVGMIAAIISDCFFDALYNDPNQREGYIACTDIISEVAMKFWDKHEKTDWEEIQFNENYAKEKGFNGCECWDSLVMEFAGKELAALGYKVTQEKGERVRTSFALLRKIAKEIGNIEGGGQLDGETTLELQKFIKESKV